MQALALAYGGTDEVIAAQFTDWPAVAQAVTALQLLAARARAQGFNVVIDLADLSGYGYHTGVQFAVYVDGLTTSLLRGGRYDAVGEVFGRARPATGFSLDLRALSRLLPAPKVTAAVLAPWDQNDAALDAAVANLRGQGQVVVRRLPGHAHAQEGLLCDRALLMTAEGWRVRAA